MPVLRLRRATAMFAAISLAAPTWAADTVRSRTGTTEAATTTATTVALDAARRQDADLEQARLWGLSVDEIRRARLLTQPGSARAAFSAPNISPVEVLGIHARSDAERGRYAELFARALHADTERIVAWIATYSAVYARLYPNEPVMDFRGRRLPRSVAAP
jgi:hypothetical protein